MIPINLSPATNSTAVRRTQQERRATAERRIIRAAMDIIAERGLARLTLAAAGEAAGYSRSIASHHFGKKDKLLIAVCRHITESFSQAMDEHDSTPGLARLLEMVTSYIQGVKTNSVRIRALQLILSEAVSNPALVDALAQVNRNSVAGLEQQIRCGIAANEIRSDIDPNAEAIFILSVLRGITAQYLIDAKAINLDFLSAQFIQQLRRNLKP